MRNTRIAAFIWIVTVGGIVTVCAAMGESGEKAGLDEHGGQERVAFSGPLPNAPGQRITAVVVNYAPGAGSPRHAHAGSVLAYVLSGEIRSQNSATGRARIYKSGETFFEPPGSSHLVSENASASAPASLLAIFVAKDGAILTTVGHEQ